MYRMILAMLVGALLTAAAWGIGLAQTAPGPVSNPAPGAHARSDGNPLCSAEFTTADRTARDAADTLAARPERDCQPFL